MSNKPFEIQDSTLRLGGVDMQAGSSGVVIPGVTQATTYSVDQVNETGNQNRTFDAVPVVIDAVNYGIWDSSSTPSDLATYEVRRIDNDSHIDGIDVVDAGTAYTSVQATANESTNMYAYIGTDTYPNMFTSWVSGDWAQVPFRPKMRPNAIDNIGGGGGSSISNGTSSVDIPVSDGSIIVSADGTGWTFDAAGSLTLPSDGNVTQNYSYTRTTTPNLSASSAVVWSGLFDYISSVKLVIQLEADETGDVTGWHSQACEAIIASRGYATGFSGPAGDPMMTVYGVIHTSTVPLVTFTVQRNVSTKLIELVATKTAACNSNPNMRIHSVEMATRD